MKLLAKTDFEKHIGQNFAHLVLKVLISIILNPTFAILISFGFSISLLKSIVKVNVYFQIEVYFITVFMPTRLSSLIVLHQSVQG